VLPPEEPPELEPELPPPELEPPPEGEKATSGLRMLRAEPCLSTSFQLREELPELLDDIVARMARRDGLRLFRLEILVEMRGLKWRRMAVDESAAGLS
jgi:hypothetical protein